MSSTEPLIQRFDHLGLISAFAHEIGLFSMTDSLKPKQGDYQVLHGELVLAMILNAH